MRLSKGIWRTYKEVPADAVIPGHRLMIRAGLVHKASAGIYNFLPFGYRILGKIETIVREELEKIDSQEILMSVVTPGQLWKKSGRWDSMTEMLKFKDKREGDLCISPTNEEAVVDIFSDLVKSYKDLPVSLYQINTKFRDEIRPRFGLLRGREFTMKDAYTFHRDQDDLDRGYRDFYDAYGAILERIGLNYIAVEADTGSMADSGQLSHEFQVLAQTGEDIIVHSDSYAANVELARTKRPPLSFNKTERQLEEVSTPSMMTIKSVCEFLQTEPTHAIKSLLYRCSTATTEKSEYVLVQLLGDDTINETKLKSYLGCILVAPASDEQIKELGLVKGFIGACRMPVKLRVLFDLHVDEEAFYVTGANQRDKHLCHFNPKRDVSTYERADLRMAKEGDRVWDSEEMAQFSRAIEVGHIFQLGNKYTKALGVSVLDQKGKAFFPLMGCYGMGITRLMAAIIEQNHDGEGIIWPKTVAPYQVHFVYVGKDRGALANDIYQELKSEDIQVLFDDREVGAGFKFKDSDLLGIPLRVVLGDKTWKKEKKLEWVERESGKQTLVDREKLPFHIKEFYGLP